MFVVAWKAGVGVGILMGVGLLLTTGSGASAQAPPVPPPAALPREVVENGPPAQRPADDPGRPPAEGLFYVPGEYVPEQGRVEWRPGYWARNQAGWTWIPARWVRQSEGWTFVDGGWQKDRATRREERRSDPALDGVRVESRPIRETVTVEAASPAWNLGPRYVSTAMVPGYPALGWGSPYGYGLGVPYANSMWGTGIGGLAVGPWFGSFGYGLASPLVGWGGPGWGGFGWGGLGWGGWGYSRFGLGMGWCW